MAHSFKPGPIAAPRDRSPLTVPCRVTKVRIGVVTPQRALVVGRQVGPLGKRDFQYHPMPIAPQWPPHSLI